MVRWPLYDILVSDTSRTQRLSSLYAELLRVDHNTAPSDAAPAALTSLQRCGSITALYRKMQHMQHSPHLRNVLGRRKSPGLRPQHLAGLRLIAEISGGALQGGRENSSAIVLQPGRLQCRNALGDTGTAGSCALLAQVLHRSAATSRVEKCKGCLQPYASKLPSC